MIATASVATIYCSHTLEHMSLSDRPPRPAPHTRVNITVEETVTKTGCELCGVLREWRRVLIPRTGRLLLSVPDMAILSTLLAEATATVTTDYNHGRDGDDDDGDDGDLVNKRHTDKANKVLSMIYGGQMDEYDVHKTGFYWQMMHALLKEYHFCNVTRVRDFDSLFYDCSEMKIDDQYISINVEAVAC